MKYLTIEQQDNILHVIKITGIYIIIALGMILLGAALDQGTNLVFELN
jgi:hypothetical protein